MNLLSATIRVMLEFVVFKPRHLAALRLQAAQHESQRLMTLDHGQQIEDGNGRAFTALLDGRPIACAGAIEIWPGRAYAWAYISDEAKHHFKGIHRYVKLALSKMPWRRVEAYVACGHDSGSAWLERLGFEFEGVARAWTPSGHDVQQWARV